MGDRSLQNTYLHGCMQNAEVKKICRRPRKDNSTAAPSSSYAYTVTTEKNVKVCQAAFVALHGIKAPRLKRKVLQFDTDIRDGHSKHDQHPKIDNETMNKIRQHIKMFPVRESYYSRSKNTHRTYLNVSLNVAAMYKDFLHKNPDLNEKVKYWLYSKIFNTELNILFGYLRSDICDTWERQQGEMKTAELDGDLAALKRLKIVELHLKKAEAFHVQLHEATGVSNWSIPGVLPAPTVDSQLLHP